jgi:GNAT superfamily N-acetyltransferase
VIPVIRKAGRPDVPAVTSILREAAVWLEQGGRVMWPVADITEGRTVSELDVFFLAEIGGEPAGTLKFQLVDPVCWPEVPFGDSAFVHGFAVRRRFAGTGLSTALLSWAVDRSRLLGRKYIRLDCDATRPVLRAFYENFGFRYHSDTVMGPYLLARYQIRL